MDYGRISTKAPLTLPSYTVANLPAASSNAYAIAYVSDGDGGNRRMVYSDGTNWRYSYNNAIVSTSASSPTKLIIRAACGGRLTLTSSTPVTTSDVTAATTLHFTRYPGSDFAGQIGLYDGSAWDVYNFNEISINLTGLTANINYDVFCFLNAGAPVLELLAWSTATARATAITTQDSVLVKSGEPTRRLLGTIRTTSVAGQCEDSESRRFVCNLQNQLKRKLSRLDSSSGWTTTSTAFQSANNSTANRVEFVRCLDDSLVVFSWSCPANNTGNGWTVVGIGLDSTSVNSADVNASFFAPTGVIESLAIPISARYEKLPGIGYHFLQLLQRVSGGTATYYNLLSDDNVAARAIGWIEA